MRGIGTMAKTQRMGIRLSQEERQQIQEAVRRLEYKGPSALVRQAIHNELVGRSSAATDSEERVAATLERVVRDVTRVARGQQALFAIVDTLVRTFLTCVPDPPADAMPQSVARARDRYARFVKAAGQAMVGDALAAMRDLVNHVE
jgi:Arc/MetJ-type ribon-helix-helix transcriptional regulator